MFRLTVMIFVMLLGSNVFCGDTNFKTPSAKTARARFERSLERIKKQYIKDLKKSRSLAFKKEDLEEIKSIDQEIEKYNTTSKKTNIGIVGKTLLWNGEKSSLKFISNNEALFTHHDDNIINHKLKYTYNDLKVTIKFPSDPNLEQYLIISSDKKTFTGLSRGKPWGCVGKIVDEKIENKEK